MKKFVLAPALAALAMFIFGFLYWGATKLPYKYLGHVSDDATASEALKKIFPKSGAYFVPGMYLDDAKHKELAERGPIAEVYYTDHGMSVDPSPGMLIKGYLYEFVLCLLLSLMLVNLAPAFKCWTCRVKFCAAIGLLMALGEYGYTVWWMHDVAWTTVQALYDFVALVIAGLVLGKLLTPKVTADAPVASA
jgi:hypothetical protein